MNYKRKKPKSGRAGCLLCKPHKRQGSPLDSRHKFSDLKREKIAKEKILYLE